MKRQLLSAPLAAWVFLSATAWAAVPDRVDFNFHVKPILSDRCFHCHGPDPGNRQADLRLDTPDGLFAAAASGDASHVIKPGDLDHSELYRRIAAADEDLRMPPPESKLSLTADEVDVIRRWIKQGAEWKPHWAFIPLQTVPVPDVRYRDWPRNEIDRFVLARLESEGIEPAPQASRQRLIRRVTFDLTGLPPTLDEIDRFLANDSPNAYERVVDRLLASERFGERMAVDWLDAARYADTYGYQADVYRAVWPYRDWIVRAFNTNLPYDQFLTWQLAGDLLPAPTRDQLIATAFNRMHRQTNEGGSIEEEFRADYVSDRTNTLGAALLGLTLECARCHDHKYDPISQRNYYQLFSFFNNIDECGLYSHFTDAMPNPTLLLTTNDQQQRLDGLDAQLERAEQQLAVLAQQRREAFEQWLAGERGEPEVPGLIGDYPFEAIEAGKLENRAAGDRPAKVFEDPQIVPGRVGMALQLSGENNATTPVGGDFGRNQPFSIALWINTPDIKQRAVILHRSRAWTDAGSRGYELLLENGCLSAALIHFWPGNAIRIRTTEPVAVGRWVHAVMTYDGSSRAAGLMLYVDGRPASCTAVRDNLFKEITGGGTNELTLGQRFRDRGFKDGLVDELKIFDRSLTAVAAAQIYDGKTLTETLAVPGGELTAAQKRDLFAYYLAHRDPPYRAAVAALSDLRRQRSAVIDPVPELMVMKEMPEPRPTFVLQRGEYDAPGESVQPGVPDGILPWADDWPPNRLGLAQWLTDSRHPLTARVAVNRFWQLLFGRGIVATPEDFGSQGRLPSHPELLDSLALSLIDSGWDVKSLLKRIVTSATYRQESDCAPEPYARDPENVLLAHGPRYRLAAEMLRDQALFAGGLLVPRVGGPPVKPYQPAGLWEEKSGAKYDRDVGEGSHRRSLYTFWKRTSPPPAMVTLDAAKREVCVVKRATTATPLQALVLLNDPQYVEAARALAERAMTEGGRLEDRLTFTFRTLTSRHPASAELAVLQQLFAEQREDFAARPEAVQQFLAVGDHQRNETLDATDLAALAVVAAAVMNLDETVMKR
jgi:hypothetical protein